MTPATRLWGAADVAGASRCCLLLALITAALNESYNCKKQVGSLESFRSEEVSVCEAHAQEQFESTGPFAVAKCSLWQNTAVSARLQNAYVYFGFQGNLLTNFIS